MINSFPEGYKPRSDQASLLDKLDDALKSNARFIIVQAPTGTGKSLVAKTIGNTTPEASPGFVDIVDSGEIYNREKSHREPTHGAIVLTTTKQLQNQYSELFSDTADLKGKGNYNCALDEQFEVDTAPCNYLPAQLRKCKSDKCCFYYNAMDKAVKSQFSSMSYSKFLTMDEKLKQRQYIICDEASELEDALVSEFTFELNHKVLRKYNTSFRYSIKKEKVYESLSSIYADIGDHIKDTKDHLSKKKKEFSGRNKMVLELRKTTLLHENIKNLINTFNECKYLVNHNVHKTTFTPLKVDKLSRNVFEHGEKIVLMSATIVDVKSFAKALGIPKDEYIFIDHPSSFNPSKSPIFVFPDQPLNNGNLQTMLKTRIIKHIEGILEHHKGEKGIIHTHTNKTAEFIYNNINPKYKKRLLTRIKGVRDNEDIVNEHIERKDEPTVLMSSSLTFGVDLKDDQGRFGIIIKLPYLPMMEERIRILMKEDPKWYVMKMLTALIQACGRTTRNGNDHSTTYIMDTNLLRVLGEYSHMLPQHFLKRCENH